MSDDAQHQILPPPTPAAAPTDGAPSPYYSPYGAQYDPAAGPGYGHGQPPAGGYVPLYAIPSAPYANASLACGALGLFGLLYGVSLFFSPAALVLGIISRRRIKASPPGTYRDGGKAVAGIVTGAIGMVISILAIIVIVYVISGSGDA